MKKLISSATFLLCIFLLCVSVSADVVSTQEPTAGNAIYIAGNPDMYPLEYYNEDTECYEGILPGIYKEISAQTGIRFAYIAADSESRQKELAENSQVEVVSAYHKGKISVAQEIELFSYSKDGQTYVVCIGFAKIIDPDVAAKITDAVRAADKNVWLSAAMELERPTASRSTFLGFIVVIALLVIALTVLVVFILKKRRAMLAKEKTKLIDPMTGIGNTDYFQDCYSHHISPLTRQLYYVGYIAIDIEKIETYFGGEQSEELQRYAASVITDAMQDNDFAARIDNGVFAFAVMAPDTDQAVKTATELIDNLNAYNRNYAEDNGVLFGCGLYPLDKQHTPCETAIYNARQGYLYAVNNKQTVCVCDSTVLDRVSLKSRLQKKISSALENKEFQAYLQFIYNVGEKTLRGAEVLSRWHSRDEGVLSPSHYIEDMKTSGMVDKLDFYIFENTCELLSTWKGTSLERIQLSCNFTRTTLSLPTFSESFEKILSKYDFSPEDLLIEITEDSLVDDSAVAYQNVLAIKKLGCKIALDDFGSGYTSFRDLCEYPVDVIKVDRDIVTRSSSARGNAVLVGIIQMAHALGIRVLCEGIETETENKRAIDAGCDYIQGFMYSRVLPLENAIDFYNRHN